MLRRCAVVEELLIMRHQVVRNSRRYENTPFVNLDPSVAMEYILRFAEVSQPNVRIVSREVIIAKIFMAIKKKNLKLESLALMLWCCATVEILPIIHHQVARYSRHYGSGTLNMYPSVECTTNYVLLKCHNQIFASPSEVETIF